MAVLSTETLDDELKKPCQRLVIEIKKSVIREGEWRNFLGRTKSSGGAPGIGAPLTGGRGHLGVENRPMGFPGGRTCFSVTFSAARAAFGECDREKGAEHHFGKISYHMCGLLWANRRRKRPTPLPLNKRTAPLLFRWSKATFAKGTT
jgi:hypothetical protein